ncbi:MAG: sugar phosphate isomerase/epimerase family protein [Dongiaceae bacterium]
MPTRLAAWLDSYRRDLKQSLHAAADDGFRLLHASSLRPELDPRELGASARRHLARYLRDLGLGLDAIAAEFAGPGLTDLEHADQRLDHLRRTLELCADLKVAGAATRICGLTDDKSRPLALELLKAVADLADRFGLPVTIHCGPDDPAEAAQAIRQLGSPDVRLGLDSGFLEVDVERTAAEPGRVGPVYLRQPELVGGVYLRDVRRRRGQIEEVPYGHGDVDFATLLAALAAAGYGGALVLRRDSAGAGVDALRQGREYILSLLSK